MGPPLQTHVLLDDLIELLHFLPKAISLSFLVLKLSLYLPETKSEKENDGMDGDCHATAIEMCPAIVFTQTKTHLISSSTSPER